MHEDLHNSNPPAADGTATSGVGPPGPPRFFRPVDGASVAVFRIAFGVIVLWECYRYATAGWIEAFWVQPVYNFPYPLLSWVQPWPGNGMYLHFGALAALAFACIVGFAYRFAALGVCLGFTYVFLLEESRYLNHFYLVALVSLVMVAIPGHRMWSLDARLQPSLRDATVPFWCVGLLRFMVFLPFFFGGIAKLNSDWAIGGEPMRMWLHGRADVPLFGSLASSDAYGEITVYFFVYGGLLLDLLGPWFLLWSRTRPVAMLFVFFFNFTNSLLFSIGIFPWFMLAASTIFFAPDWPRRLLRDAFVRPNRAGVLALVVGALTGGAALAFRGEPGLVPFAVSALAGALTYWTFHERLRRRRAGASLVAALFDPVELPPDRPAPDSLRPAQRVWLATLALWIAFHCLFPLRHLLIPGNVSWTEEGHRFAWHMKLRDKRSRVQFFYEDDSGRGRRPISHEDWLAEWQVRKMSTRPYMIRQFAHFLREQLEAKGLQDVKVYASAEVSLNGRPPRPLIDENTDLAAEPISWWKADWILPLREPLRR